MAQHLLKALPKYAGSIVTDPQFHFEPRLVARFTRHLPPKKKKEGRTYRHNFDYVVSDSAKKTGLDFITQNSDLLVRAEGQFPNVPKEIPVGILDAETSYGTTLPTANFPVVQTLLTIAVFRPNFQTEGWAEEQLISFLRICEKNGWKPFEKLGSRTGAMGKPQFEPSSYEKLAMFWNDSEKTCEPWTASPTPIDLDRNEDTICSTFNYLYANGFHGNERRWRRALHRYNKDWDYCDAILDAADFFGGRPNHHHYQRISERTAKPKPRAPQPALRAATK